MMKKILLLMVCCAIGAYLLLALTAFNRRPSGLCADLELVVKDSAYAGFITRSEIMSLLKKKKLNPVGRPLDSICCDILEQAIEPHPLVERAECFITPSGKVCVEVSQRVPVLRVMDSSGRDYFVDDKGSVMPTGLRCAASLPIATGDVSRSLATNGLFRLALLLRQDAFWNAQVEQIHVLPDGGVELVPRVGNHLIYLGQPDSCASKLARVKEFYVKALNTVGWNKYKRISVEFGNQVICTK